MAKHRIRRWFQFGILDLLIFMTAVAALVVLSRPIRPQVNKALPWLVGGWIMGDGTLFLYPDGYYRWDNTWTKEHVHGNGWGLTRFVGLPDAFLLECGTLRFIVRSEWSSGTMDLLNEDGKVRSQLQQFVHLNGPIVGGKPHGMWTLMLGKTIDKTPAVSLEYRNEELTDFHDRNGNRDLEQLNRQRRDRALPELGKSDFSGVMQERKRHE